MIVALAGLIGSFCWRCCLSLYLVLGAVLTLAQLGIILSLFFNLSGTVDNIANYELSQNPSWDKCAGGVACPGAGSTRRGGGGWTEELPGRQGMRPAGPRAACMCWRGWPGGVCPPHARLPCMPGAVHARSRFPAVHVHTPRSGCRGPGASQAVRPLLAWEPLPARSLVTLVINLPPPPKKTPFPSTLDSTATTASPRRWRWAATSSWWP